MVENAHEARQGKGNMVGQFGSPFILAASRFSVNNPSCRALTTARQSLLEGFFIRRHSTAGLFTLLGIVKPHELNRPGYRAGASDDR